MESKRQVIKYITSSFQKVFIKCVQTFVPLKKKDLHFSEGGNNPFGNKWQEMYVPLILVSWIVSLAVHKHRCQERISLCVLSWVLKTADTAATISVLSVYMLVRPWLTV